jgi:hypothetical protein
MQQSNGPFPASMPVIHALLYMIKSFFLLRAGSATPNSFRIGARFVQIIGFSGLDWMKMPDSHGCTAGAFALFPSLRGGAPPASSRKANMDKDLHRRPRPQPLVLPFSTGFGMNLADRWVFGQ